MRRAAAVLLAAALTGCAPQGAEQPQPSTVASIRDAVQQAAPEHAEPPAHAIYPPAVALILRWEVSSRAHYERALSRPIWPGGASGVTWGIGYDGGHQTATRIRSDWHEHEHVDRLALTAGITGERARDALPAWRDIQTDWPLAVDVYERAMLPRYRHIAARAFGHYFEHAPPAVQGALLSVVLNRGGSMMGDSRRELRTIRDECLPAGDRECVAREIEASCRVWRGHPLERGLCARRQDEARLARG